MKKDKQPRKKSNNKKKLPKISSKKISKADKNLFIKNLINPTKGASAADKSIYNKQQTKFNEVPAFDDKNQLIIGNSKYKLTPKGILWAALDAHYKIGGDMNKFNEFMKELLKHLSMLASNNQLSDMFGEDFNDFFEIYVKTLNLAGKLKAILDQNGIYFDVKKFLTSSVDEQLEQIDDEDESTDDGDDQQSEGNLNRKPKKK